MGSHLGLLGEIAWEPKELLEIFLRAHLEPFSYWKYDTLHAIVEFGSAFFEEISKGNANLSELPHTLNIFGGNIDVSFVLRGKRTLVCSSSSIVY